MENELKNPSRSFRSEKFVWSESLAEWKMAFSGSNFLKAKERYLFHLKILIEYSTYLESINWEPFIWALIVVSCHFESGGQGGVKASSIFTPKYSGLVMTFCMSSIDVTTEFSQKKSATYS